MGPLILRGKHVSPNCGTPSVPMRTTGLVGEVCSLGDSAELFLRFVWVKMTCSPLPVCINSYKLRSAHSIIELNSWIDFSRMLAYSASNGISPTFDFKAWTVLASTFPGTIMIMTMSSAVSESRSKFGFGKNSMSQKRVINARYWSQIAVSACLARASQTTCLLSTSTQM